MTSLSHPRLLEVLEYDANTGVFRWKVRTSIRITAGAKAGCLGKDGYGRIGVDGRLYKTSRLAWFFTYGDWPSHPLDHINRNRRDDRLVNLREATAAQNGANMSLRRSNTSGFKGVHLNKHAGRWAAQLSGRHIGSFASPEEAAEAYNQAARSRFGEFAATNDEEAV